MKKMVEFECYDAGEGAKTGRRISVDPETVSVVEDLADTDEACQIICEHGQYTVAHTRAEVLKKLKR